MTPFVVFGIDEHGVGTLALNRPDKHNALDDELVKTLLDTLLELQNDPRLRVLVLTGMGRSFCAGGDLLHMERMAEAGGSANINDALLLGRCLRALSEFPRPVIARVNGSAYGGGVGLVACADIAIASSQSTFCLAEVRLGLAAATIVPYVVAAMGARAARRLMLTAESFDASQACAMGLLHAAVGEAELDQRIEQEIQLLLRGGPQAQQISKQLVQDAWNVDVAERDGQLTTRAHALASIRTSAEAREGMRAYRERRRPAWASA
ncbi:MAG: enoyl-CoA hydratase/isomerase family protein [Proteobacteria bacterium]|nr:enoyl-CoA hydratase/isomerase family protein [Pseudomonadota bacterium]